MTTGGAAEQATDDTEQDDVQDDENEELDDFDGEFDAKRARETIRAQRESEHEARRSLKRERAERRKLEARIAELESSGDGDKAAKELQAANDRATAAEARLRKQTLRSEAMEQATKLGFNSPATAARLIDQDDVEWDDDQPTNVRALLREILRDDPSLKRRVRDDQDEDEDAGAGRRGGSGGTQDLNSAIRAAAGRG